MNEKDYLFWKNYRENLYSSIKEQETHQKQESTPENIVNMAKEIGVKPTARYFNISPSKVRYWLKKMN